MWQLRTCGIQPTGVVTMAMECYMLVVTCVLLIRLICMPSGFGLLAYISDKSLMPMLQLAHLFGVMYCENKPIDDVSMWSCSNYFYASYTSSIALKYIHMLGYFGLFVLFLWKLLHAFLGFLLNCMYYPLSKLSSCTITIKHVHLIMSLGVK